MTEIIWKNGKVKVLFTKEERRNIRRRALNELVNNWKFWVLMTIAVIFGFCMSYIDRIIN